MIKQNKNKYFKDRLDQSSGNSKATWKVLNEVLKRNKKSTRVDSFNVDDQVITNNAAIANGFNNHYINIPDILSSSVPDSIFDYKYFLSARLDTEFELAETNVSEVTEIISEIKNVSPGYDELPASVLKKCSNLLVTPITHICNLSMFSGIFPSKLKVAKVIPVYKKGKRNDFNNYRPISMLPVISKIVEELVYKRLYRYLDEHNLLSDKQLGFRQGRSTTAAVLTLTDYVLRAFDRYEYTIGVFLDFTKAFDTVNHQILLGKLEHLGIRGVAQRWFGSYLSERQKYVSFNGSSSMFGSMNYSVPHARFNPGATSI